jgi:hypothetical protein
MIKEVAVASVHELPRRGLLGNWRRSEKMKEDRDCHAPALRALAYRLLEQVL